MVALSTGARRQPLGRLAAAVVGTALLVAAAVSPISAAAPNPSLGVADVDGDPGEWSLAADFFAEMTADGNAGNPVVANLHARYDCDAGVLYALVLTVEGQEILADRPEEAYLRLDGSGKIVSGESGDDGSAPDFAWVGLSGDRATGFEASAGVAEGSYTLRAHVLVADDSSDGYATIDTVPREAPLTVACGEVQPTEGVGPSESPGGSELPAEGSPPPSEAPTGNVGGAVGTPRITLPPTSTESVQPASGADTVRLAMVLLGTALAIFAVAPRRRRLASSVIRDR